MRQYIDEFLPEEAAMQGTILFWARIAGVTGMIGIVLAAVGLLLKR